MSVNVWYEKEIKGMLKDVAGTKTVSEVEKLFDKILTPREINDMARRLAIGKMLAERKSYLEIQEALRVSPTIVSRVANKIGYGFRRTSSRAKKIGEREPAKPTVKYKGLAPYNRIVKK